MSKASYHVILGTNAELNGRRPSVTAILEICAEKNVKLAYGDIINFGEDRQKYAYIYAEGNFIKNPDFSGAGYLTIPMAITRNLPDAVKYYSKVIRKIGVEFGEIELGRDDALIKAIFKQPSDILVKAEFSYAPYQDSLYVGVGRQSHTFLMMKRALKQADIEKAFAAPINTQKTKPAANGFFKRLMSIVRRKPKKA